MFSQVFFPSVLGQSYLSMFVSVFDGASYWTGFGVGGLLMLYGNAEILYSARIFSSSHSISVSPTPIGS